MCAERKRLNSLPIARNVPGMMSDVVICTFHVQHGVFTVATLICNSVEFHVIAYIYLHVNTMFILICDDTIRISVDDIYVVLAFTDTSLF